jgi:hypothetical protein
VIAVVVGLDGGECDRARLEHQAVDLAGALGDAVSLICTHEVAEEGGHYGASLLLDAPPTPQTVESLERALDQDGYSAVLVAPGEERPLGSPQRRAIARDLAERLAARSDGRAIRFAGQAEVPQTATVAEVEQATAIEEVVALGAYATEDSVIHTNGFLRPRFHGGRLVLHLTPLADGQFRPFEVPSPHKCCSDDH